MSRYILCDRKEELIQEWKKYFINYKKVEIRLGGFFEIKCEAVVSPANSSGEMKGGLDYYLSLFFDKNIPKLCQEEGIGLKSVLSDPFLAQKFYRRLDWTIEKKVKEKIRKESGGKLPVGKAILVETGKRQIPYLIAAPTMKAPGDISQTDNVYRAMKAIIQVAEENQLGSVLVPGLGTGIGSLRAEECAKQMAKAFGEVYKGRFLFTYP